MSFLLRESEVYGVTVRAAHWNSAHVRHVYINYLLQFLSLSPLSATLPIYDEFLTASDSLSLPVLLPPFIAFSPPSSLISHLNSLTQGECLTVPCLMCSFLSYLPYHQNKRGVLALAYFGGRHLFFQSSASPVWTYREISLTHANLKTTSHAVGFMWKWYLKTLMDN